MTRDDYAAEFTGKNAVLRANVLTNMETANNLLFSTKPSVVRSRVIPTDTDPETTAERMDFLESPNRSDRSVSVGFYQRIHG